VKQVSDRKKLRREYLRKKGKAHSKSVLYGAICVALWVMVALFLFFVNEPGVHMPPMDYAIATIICLAAVWFTSQLVKSEAEAKLVPYVPPVTPNTLPADEILVRGSEEPPVAQSDVLLRAAKEQETPQEELLRVSQSDEAGL